MFLELNCSKIPSQDIEMSQKGDLDAVISFIARYWDG